MMTNRTEGIRVLIVDDELPARQRVADLLKQDSGIESILEATDGNVAVDMIRDFRPDLVLLDVQMPERNGLEVIEAIGPQSMPFTVFVTAYDHHAIRAFEANALDYLLKPFSDERFESMLSRVKRGVEDRLLLQFSQGLTSLMRAELQRETYIDRLPIKTDGITRLLRVGEIDWIESAGVYVQIHAEGKSILHRGSLMEMERSLDPRKFLRTHRTDIINIDSVLQLEALSHGEFEVLLKDGSRRKVSRTYRASLERRIGQKF